MFARLLLLCSLCCLIAGPVPAGALPVPSVEYSADRVVESAAGSITSKVYSAKGKERTETNMRGMQSVVIIRQDKQVGWMLLPAQKMYQTLDFAQATQQSQPAAASSDKVTLTQLGTETVEGFKTTKYQMTMRDNSAAGFYWISDQGIPVKMEMTMGAGKNPSAMTMTLKNLQIGSQDPKLFELPAGYTAMPAMPGMSTPAGRPTSALPGKQHTEATAGILSQNAALRNSLSGSGSL